MICFASEDTTVTAHPPKTYFIPGNCKTSRYTGMHGIHGTRMQSAGAVPHSGLGKDMGNEFNDSNEEF